MNKLRLSLFIGAALVVSVALCSTAQAQSRVFVSGTGNDANPCTRPSPCRNFQRGHDAVATGGEVVALDSAGYGPVTITKSVTITGEGVMAGITAASGDAIRIAGAGITVNLRSLSIQGNGSGDSGISATEFTVLHIENCIVNGFASAGILVFPTTAGTRKVFIKDSVSRNNASVGIFLESNGTALIATVEGTRAENNSHGIVSSGSGATVTARGCLASGNSEAGFQSQLSGVLNIESCVASNNGTDGIANFDGGTVRVSNSTVTKNTEFGFFNETGFPPGTFESRGNNTVSGNGTDTSAGITPLTAL